MMRKTIRYLIVYPLLLVSICAAIIAYALFTESGTQLVWKNVRDYLPKSVAIRDIDGVLAGPLTIHQLQVTESNLRISLSSIELDWQLDQLLFDTLHIEKLILTNGQIVMVGGEEPVPSEAKQPFIIPETLALPISIAVNALGLRNITIQKDDQKPIIIEDLDLAARADNRHLTLKSLTLKSSVLDATAVFKVATRSPFKTRGNFTVTAYPPDMPALQSEIHISGTLDKLQVRQTALAPYQHALSMTAINLASAPELAVDLSVQNLRLNAINAAWPVVTINTESKTNVQPNLDIIYQIDSTVNSAEFGDYTIQLGGGYAKETVEISALEIRDHDLPTTITVNGNVDLSGAQPALNINTNWTAVQWPPRGNAVVFSSQQGQASMQGTPQNFQTKLHATLNNFGSFDVNGQFNNGSINARVEAHEVQLPETPYAHFLHALTAQVSGTLDAYSLELQARLAGGLLDTTSLQVTSDGNQESITISSFKAQHYASVVSGNADVAWKDKLAANVTLLGKNINPGIIAPEWPGKLNLQLQTTINQMPTSDWSVDLEKLKLDGSLRDQPVDLSARGTYQGPDIKIAYCKGSIAGADIDISGTIGNTAQLSWTINAPAIQTIIPDVRGEIFASGQLRGKLTHPTVRLDLQARDLAYQQISAGLIGLNGHLDLTGTDTTALTLQAENMMFAEESIDKLAAQLTGTPDQHSFTSEVVAPDYHGNVTLTGSTTPTFEKWQGRLAQAKFQHLYSGEWQLTNAAEMQISHQSQKMTTACFESAPAKLCIDARNDNTGLAANWDITNFEIQRLMQFSPTPLIAEGRLTMQGSVAHLDTALAADVSVELSSGSLSVMDLESENEDDNKMLFKQHFDSGAANIKLQKNILKATTKIQLDANTGISAQLLVPAQVEPWPEKTFNATAGIKLNDFSLLDELVEQIAEPSGQLDLAITAFGKIDNPSLEVKGRLTDGRVVLPELAIQIEEVTADVRTENGKIISDLSALSGNGDIHLNAIVSGDIKTPEVSATLQGNQFLAVNNSDASVTISPDLTLQYTLQNVILRGRVDVPAANITPGKSTSGTSVVSISDDQVIITNETLATGNGRKPLQVDAKIKLTVGKKVFIDSHGLKARLGGELNIVDPPESGIATGTGELRIEEGTFKAYGQDLNIKVGKVIFAGGPLTKPGIDLKAVRIPAVGIEVGVLVRGPLQQPVFSLFSSPSMVQSEQLSYLLFGRPLKNNNRGEQSALTKLLLSAGVKGGQLITEKVGSKLGVDDISISSDPGEDDSQAELTVGKYLTPRLYVSYGVGLFEPVNTLKTRYDLSRRWTFETQTTESASGGDLIFSIESGGN